MRSKLDFWIPKINSTLFKIGVIIIAANFLCSSLLANWLDYTAKLISSNLTSNNVYWSYDGLNIRYFSVRSQKVLGIDQNMGTFLDTKKLEDMGPLKYKNFIKNFNISSYSETMEQVQFNNYFTKTSNCTMESGTHDYSCLSQSFMALPEKVDTCQCIETSYLLGQNISTLMINDQYIYMKVNNVIFSRKSLNIGVTGTFDSIKTTFYTLNTYTLFMDYKFAFLMDINYKDIFLTLFIIYKGYKSIKHIVFMAYAYILKKLKLSKNKRSGNSNRCTFCDTELQISTVVRLSNSLHSCINCYRKKVIPIAISLFLVVIIYEIVYMLRGYENMNAIFGKYGTTNSYFRPILYLLIILYSQNPLYLPFALWLCLYAVFGLIALILFIKERKIFSDNKNDKNYELEPLHPMVVNE